MKQPRFKQLLSVVITILIISLASITGCAKQGPFIPEFIMPTNYTEITFSQLDDLLYGQVINKEDEWREWVGNYIIIKDIKIDKYALDTRMEDHIYLTFIKCIAKKPADLNKLKEGDVIDLIGVFVDVPLSVDENIGVVVLGNCQFLPSGLYPFPLPGSTEAPWVMY
jgi:hypothetical protein